MENDYKAKETELKNKIDGIERDYPGYDEYRYHLDEIGHMNMGNGRRKPDSAFP